MVEHRLVAVVHLVAEFTQAKAEVDVLEAVDERIVEPFGLSERFPSEEGTPGGHDRKTPRLVHSGVVGREAGVDVPRIAIFGDRHSSVLHGVVWEQQLAPDDSCPRLSIRIAHESVEPTFKGQRVVVQEDQVVAGRGRGSVIA